MKIYNLYTESIPVHPPEGIIGYILSQSNVALRLLELPLFLFFTFLEYH